MLTEMLHSLAQGFQTSTLAVLFPQANFDRNVTIFSIHRAQSNFMHRFFLFFFWLL